MTGKDLKKLLLKNGWSILRVNGSHHILVKGDDVINLPIHSNKDMKKGLEEKILKQAGLKQNKKG